MQSFENQSQKLSRCEHIGDNEYNEEQAALGSRSCDRLDGDASSWCTAWREPCWARGGHIIQS